MKVLLGLPLRQTQGFVQSVLARRAGGWTALDYSTVSRHQKRLEVQFMARPSQGGLHVLPGNRGDG